MTTPAQAVDRVEAAVEEFFNRHIIDQRDHAITDVQAAGATQISQATAQADRAKTEADRAQTAADKAVVGIEDGTVTRAKLATEVTDELDSKATTQALTTGLSEKSDEGHKHTADGISDATTVGKAVMRATSAQAARNAIGAGTSSLVLGTSSSTAKAGNWNPTAANITDATTVGRNVLTAASQAAARTAIGAGTSSLALGTTSSTAKAGNWKPAVADITDMPIMDSEGGAGTLALRDSEGKLRDPSPPTDAGHLVNQDYVIAQVSTKLEAQIVSTPPSSPDPNTLYLIEE